MCVNVVQREICVVTKSEKDVKVALKSVIHTAVLYHLQPEEFRLSHRAVAFLPLCGCDDHALRVELAVEGSGIVQTEFRASQLEVQWKGVVHRELNQQGLITFLQESTS